MYLKLKDYGQASILVAEMGINDPRVNLMKCEIQLKNNILDCLKSLHQIEPSLNRP